MRRIVPLALAALLGLAGAGRAGDGCTSCAKGGHCQTQCTVPPEPDCPDCSCPCDHRLSLTLFGPEHAQEFIATLANCDASCCERIKAAKKLGHRLHADFCCQPEVLDALLCALLTDPCWEVRRTAAWSLRSQDARTEQALLALYVSSKLDPHFVVRDNSAIALDALTLCRGACYKALTTSGERLVKELRAQKAVPGKDAFRIAYGEAYTQGAPAPLSPEAVPAPKDLKAPEHLPSPKEPERLPAPKGKTSSEALPLPAGPSAAAYPEFRSPYAVR
jgi:hypothetical protein